ncbi:MAG: hypothetical protein H7062_16545 [Candidatus Saccharimonas sp.]|nr:hypothetical protein [Planctomycetaceae bacterium]
MPSSSTRPVRLPCVCIAFGLASTMLAGCYSPYGYQGQYGGPGYYGQPAYQTPGYPGGPVYPGSPGQPLGNGGIYVPGGTAPGSSPGMSPTPLTPPTYENNGPIRFESPNSNAPPFNPNPVPDPGDEMKSSNPGASKPTLTPTSGSVEEDLTTPFNQTGNSGGGSTGAPAQPAQLPTEADPFFEMPQQQKSSATSGTSVIQTVSYEQPQSAKLNPYGRDTKHANPTWLRGVVDYDQKQRTWSILYSANPDPRDSNGGVLTLANHPNLAKCRLGEVILAEGAIDARQTDARGKPIYVLDNVTPLQPQQ